MSNFGQIRAKSAKLLGIAILLFLLIGGNRVFAQPSGYCVYNVSGCWNGWYNYPQYGEYGWGVIDEIKIINTATNAVVIDWLNTIGSVCILDGSAAGTINLKLGNTYKITIYSHNLEVGYSAMFPLYRVWIDYNQNGAYDKVGSPSEVIGNYENTGISSNCCYTVKDNYSFTFTVPCAASGGLTKMRVAYALYYYYYGWDMTDPCVNGYAGYSYDFGQTTDLTVNIIADIQATVPATNAILYAQQNYDGTTRLFKGQNINFTKPSVTMGAVQPAGAILNYSIVGPLPSTNVVYLGLDPVTGSPNIDMGGSQSYTIKKATSLVDPAYTPNNGDGSVYFVVGGSYKEIIAVSGSGCPGQIFVPFNAALDNDMSAAGLVSPKNNAAPSYFKYLTGQTISITGTFQNVGLNDVSAFEAYAFIYDASGNLVDSLYHNYDASFNPGDVVLHSTQSATINFGAVKYNTVSMYKVVLKVVYAADQQAFNNVFPRSGDADYTFQVQYDIELASNRLIIPAQGDILMGNRPVIPTAEFKNNGVSDASNVPAYLNVYTSSGLKYWSSQPVIVQDIPSGKYNTKVQTFDVLKIPDTGTYTAELIISSPDDLLRSNDTLRTTFSVQGGLAGTYRVGAGQDFPTIDSAMNALYYRGLAGSVSFELTDSYYKVTGPAGGASPAWDFRSYIINLGYNADTKKINTVTWKPSLQNSLSRSSVTIDLASSNGQGIVFGQANSGGNSYSLFSQFISYKSLTKQYANSQGYINFDGGSQKSLKFRILSSQPHASVFYLGRGSSNISIKNCLIENGTPATATNIVQPMSKYSPTSGFTFIPDMYTASSVNYSYSAGIVSRSNNGTSASGVPATEAQGIKVLGLDTLQNMNNTFQNNEIYGFGYGIMDIGIGQLWNDPALDYIKYFNKNENISNNLIYNCTRAGIYLGYNEGSKIYGNRIYNVTNDTINTAGIMAGGDGSSSYKGFENVNLDIRGNEISAISSGVLAAGIKVEQVQSSFPHPSKGQTIFPDIAENSTIANNSIWGITTTKAPASRAGIYLTTERQPNANAWTQFTTPNVKNYFSRYDNVVNNTIILGVNGGIFSTGATAGIGLQDVAGAVVKNNAIALQDVSVDNAAPVYSAIFYQGRLDQMGFISDRNVFWYPSNAPAALFRVVETNLNDVILDAGSRNDYATLSQWQQWTNNDMNSVFGNFTTDLVYLGTDPNMKLRVNSNPVPTGSLLNNRGDKISWLTTDIDGNVRGAAGQRYDIGASEFNGKLYVIDMEALSIPSPGAYRAGSGTFSDAEYIMTKAPVDVTTLIRNSGNLLQNGISVTVKIYRELPNGQFSTTAEINQTTTVTAQSGESALVSFNLADGKGTDFYPKTYADLKGTGYVVPDQFVTMWGNVTPKYRIDVGLGADQYNANNIVSKVVRFYLEKSAMRIVASVENSMTTLNANSTSDQIAGRLNYNNLVAGLLKLGWYVKADSGRYDYDIFDRVGWEQRAVDYSNYRTIFWGDGDDKAMTRFSRNDIESFLNLGNQIEKKNIIIASQEMVRQQTANTINQDLYFVNNILSAVDKQPEETPIYGDGGWGSYSGNYITGVNLERGLQELVKRTGVAGDKDPYCGLFQIYGNAQGFPQIGYYYNTHTTPKDSIASIATSTLNRNVVLVGIDWRHWNNPSMLIRGSIDFIERNGGTIVPVELLSFDAKQSGARVNVIWSTASEYNTDRFEIERAIRSEIGTGSFDKIGEEKAYGKSSTVINYGPFSDQNVTMGNTYVYRLKMIDMDGKYSYSSEKEVKIAGDNSTWLSDAQPNPVQNQSKITFSVSDNQNVVITIYDLNGKTIDVIQNGSVNAGSHDLMLNTSNMVSGVYTIVMQTGGQNFTKQIEVIK